MIKLKYTLEEQFKDLLGCKLKRNYWEASDHMTDLPKDQLFKGK